jgi:hypothetical protein
MKIWFRLVWVANRIPFGGWVSAIIQGTLYQAVLLFRYKSGSSFERFDDTHSLTGVL